MTLTQDAAQIVGFFDSAVFRRTLGPVQAKGIWGRWYRAEMHSLYKDIVLVTYTHIKGL